MKASDAETAAESEVREAEAEEQETKELWRNWEAEAPNGAALRERRLPTLATDEILPEWSAIGVARASAMTGVSI